MHKKKTEIKNKKLSVFGKFRRAIKVCGIRVAIIKVLTRLLGLKNTKIVSQQYLASLEQEVLEGKNKENFVPVLTMKSAVNTNIAIKKNDNISEKNTLIIENIKYLITCTIPMYNAANYLSDAVNSVISQTIGFKSILLLLIDDGSTDETKDICMEYTEKYPNIKYIEQPHSGVSAARNKGIEISLQIKSAFTFFLDADDKYNKNHIKNVIDLLIKYPESVFVSGVMKFFEAKNNLSDQYNFPIYKSTREINTLAENSEALYVGNVAQGGWRTSVLEKYRFNENLDYSEDIDFIFRILCENKFVFSKDIEYLYRIRFSKDSAVDLGIKNLQWFSRVWNVFMPLYSELLEKRGFIPFFVQQTVLENLRSLFGQKLDKEMISQIDYEKLNLAMHFIMQNTDDSIIEYKLMDYWQKMYFYKFKYGKYNLTRFAPIPTFILNDKDATDEGRRFGYLGCDPLVLHIVNEKNGILMIRASMRCLTYKSFKLDVKADFETTVMEVPSPFERDKIYFCGKQIFPRKYYEIKIDLKKAAKNAGNHIRFYLTTDYGVSVSVKYDALPHSGIGFNVPFCIGDEFIIKRTSQDNVLSIAPFTEKELIETCPVMKPYAGIGTPHEKSVKKFDSLKKSIIENFRAFSNRRIWLFMDRGYDIGNNAEALFRHCVTKNDGIEKYYVIPDESFAERFAGLPYVFLGSLEYKLMCCFAEKFISSYLYGGGLTYKFGIEKHNKAHKEIWEDICNFKKLARSFFRGDIIHVQHGVIMQDISYYITKFDENARMLLNVSQKEYDYISKELKPALDNDILRLTGLPKNDYLEYAKNNPKSQKIVLFAPSWDMKFDKEGVYMPTYKHSPHFKYINSVLNSSALLDMLEEKGYTLYFKPHYRVLPQMKDFNIDPRVRVVKDEIDRYELYAMTDLMISDYSGIAFDFAYLKKPVVYAHFVESKYDETYYSYSRDGFGEICPDIETLSETVIGYINEGCKMSDKYVKRVDSFFSIQDGNNSERAYQEMLKLPDTRKKIFN